MNEKRPQAYGRRLGYLEALCAACLWGSSGIFSVHLFRMGVPPESVALLRSVVGALVLVAVFGVARPESLRVNRRGLLVLGLGGGIAVGVFQLAYQLSTDAVGVPTTVALMYVASALVVAAAGPLLGEWPTRTRVALAAVTLVGVWLSVAGADQVGAAFGVAGLLWGGLAGLSYAAYTLLGRFTGPRYGVVPTVTYSTIGGCIMLAGIVLPARGGIVLPATPSSWALVVVFGVVTIALAQFLFFDALSRIEASRASLATPMEPVVAAILATLLLDQGLRTMGWLGIALVVAGVGGVGVNRRWSNGRSISPLRTTPAPRHHRPGHFSIRPDHPFPR